MKTYAVVKGGVVVNVVLWDGVSVWTPGPGLQPLDISNELVVGPTWNYTSVGGTFTNGIFTVSSATAVGNQGV